jgi:hypothetical protein
MKRYFLLSAFAFCSLALSAQETQEITLNEAIALARTQSVDAAVALNELKTAYWEVEGVKGKINGKRERV